MPGRKIRQADWDKLKSQIGRLVELPIKHPSIPSGSSHRAYLVTNGELDEPVRIEIVDRNVDWMQRYGRSLEVITKGQILEGLMDLQTAFWPKEPEEVKTLLELFLRDGRKLLDRGMLADLVWSELPFKGGIPQAQYVRAISSAAILCAYALAPHAIARNHVALIEGWTIFGAAVLALSEKQNLSEGLWRDTFRFADEAAGRSLQDLWNDVRDRPNLVEGDVISEAASEMFLRARTTIVVGLLASWGLSLIASESDGTLGQLVDFIREKINSSWLWGESAIPYFLSVIWFLGRGRGVGMEELLMKISFAIAHANSESEDDAFPDPYNQVDEVMRIRVLGEGKFDENFKGRSYTLEALIALVARRLRSRFLDHIWPAVTRVAFASFSPDSRGSFYEWTSREGALVTRHPRLTQSWRELLEESRLIATDSLPYQLVARPSFLLRFLLVYPHRVLTEAVKFLDDWVSTLPRIH